MFSSQEHLSLPTFNSAEEFFLWMYMNVLGASTGSKLDESQHSLAYPVTGIRTTGSVSRSAEDGNTVFVRLGKNGEYLSPEAKSVFTEYQLLWDRATKQADPEARAAIEAFWTNMLSKDDEEKE